MKDSKQYSKEVQQLYRSLKRKFPKVEKVTYDEPVDAMVYAVVSENITDKQASTAIKHFSEYFVNVNDLRVSRPEEIIELLGPDTPEAKDTALTLGKTLRAVFDRYNTVSLAPLKKMGKRPAKKTLEKLDGTTGFVVDYCMLTALQAHAVPLTKKMIEYLKDNQMVYPDSDQHQIEGFLARQISADKAYEFYILLRRESETAKPKKRKTTIRKKEKKAKLQKAKK